MIVGLAGVPDIAQRDVMLIFKHNNQSGTADIFCLCVTTEAVLFCKEKNFTSPNQIFSE